MIIGKTNNLLVSSETDTGYILLDEAKNEVFLPHKYALDSMSLNDFIDVFVYRDSENKTVATTLKPTVQLDEFAYLQAREVNGMGAFMDWGLPKDLMVPYAEHTEKMEIGSWHLIFMLADEKTERLMGSCKVNDFVFFDEIDVKVGDQVDLLLYKLTDLGMNVIVNNMYKGLVFNSNIHKDILPGDRIKGFVKKIREDGNLDIVLEPIGYSDSIDKTSNSILEAIKKNDSFLPLTDKSNPEEIQNALGMSKKAFKRGLGFLYKNKKIEIGKDGLRLLK